MRHRSTYLLFFLVCALKIAAFAGDWSCVEGRFARVEYIAQQQKLADSLLIIADDYIPKLCQWYALNEDNLKQSKARIILTDAPDVSNGFAIGDAVVIYALSSMYATAWSGKIPWYEQVLKHELVHYVTFRKLQRRLNLFGEIAGLTVPRWFYEGTAQYFSEDWNIYRGDVYLKNAVLYGKLNYEALDNIEDGALLYASAHAFVRYLARQYGDSALIHLMSYQPDGWYFDFDDAFKSVYKKKAEDIFPEFVRHMTLYYGGKLAEYPVSKLPLELPVYGYQTQQLIPLNDADSTYLWLGKFEDIHLYRTALIIKKEKGKLNHLKTISTAPATDLFISHNQQYLAFGSYQAGARSDQLSLAFKWQVFDLRSGKSWTVANNIRARQAAFSGQNELLLVEVHAGGSIIKKYSLNGKQDAVLFESAMPVGRLSRCANDDILFDAQRPNGFRDLFLWQNDSLLALTNDDIDDRSPVLLNDSLFVFNRFEQENPSLAVYNLNTRSFRLLLFDQFEYWLQGMDLQRNEIIIAGLQADRRPKLFSLSIDSLLKSSAARIENNNPRYSQWITKQPPALQPVPTDDADNSKQRRALSFPQAPLIHLFSFALPTYDEALGWGVYGLTGWIEALQRQSLAAAFIIFPEEADRSVAALTHSLKFYNSDWLTSLYHGPVIFSHKNERYIELYQSMGGIDWIKRWYPGGNPRAFIQFSAAYSWHRQQLNETIAGVPSQFSYHGPQLSCSFKYLLPTRLYPALPKRQFAMELSAFQSLNKKYDFRIVEAQLSFASNLIVEEFGLKAQGCLIHSAGALPPFKTVGIDRYYELDIPRDYTFSRTLRGVREDITGKQLYWSSAELLYLIDERTGYDLLILPIDNLAVNAFFDYAGVVDGKTKQAYSYGGELSFGGALARLALGYAVGRRSDETTDQRLYGRLTLFLSGQ